VLRSFWRSNETIEGLERPEGGRFTLTGFRSRWYPQFAESRLDARIASIKGDIECAERLIRDSKAELKTVAANYIDWETEK
jgi:hypothetical protein